MRITALAERQKGLVHHRQLRSMGLTKEAIRHRVAVGRLYPKWPGVYAVGRGDLSHEGEWMGAVLTCGLGSALSHASAAALWGICRRELRAIEVSVPAPRRLQLREGIVVHRRNRLGPGEVTRHRGIPVTSPIQTLIDIAARFETGPLEEAVNEGIRHRLTTLPRLRAALDACPRQPGAGVLRKLIDARTFRLTDSVLERLFIPMALRAGLPRPLTQQRVNGYRVDFYWPDLGLVVETDGGSFHRTAAQQTRDRRRDQAHSAAGLTPLRFTHDQIKHEPRHVEAVLAQVVRRLRAFRAPRT